uniref:RING-type domain-containing protein n=1 Tax=Maylandia zebra TaxID=106582 RepID=A0A3P9DUH3_9CICH
ITPAAFFSLRGKMSSQSEMNLSCSICYDIFRDPIMLSCSHSFCKDCLQMWWKEKPVRKCRICICQMTHPVTWSVGSPLSRRPGSSV